MRRCHSHQVACQFREKAIASMASASRANAVTTASGQETATRAPHLHVAGRRVAVEEDSHGGEGDQRWAPDLGRKLAVERRERGQGPGRPHDEAHDDHGSQGLQATDIGAADTRRERGERSCGQEADRRRDHEACVLSVQEHSGRRQRMHAQEAGAHEEGE